jgi:hypothetical protein
MHTSLGDIHTAKETVGMPESSPKPRHVRFLDTATIELVVLKNSAIINARAKTLKKGDITTDLIHPNL